MDFDTAFERLIGHEGGLVDHQADPGGVTKFGISQRSYPGEDIRGMTLARAKEIYRRDYWGPSGCDAVPDRIKFLMFDAGVNSGPTAAIKLLQRSVGTTEDGILGPITLTAAGSMHPARLASRLSAHRLLLMADLPAWPAFSRGWVRRVASNLLEAS